MDVNIETEELKREGLVLVLSSPSGCGKTTVADVLLRDERNNLVRSISVTTRAPREGEENARDYFFVSEEEFLKLRDSGQLIEHAKVFDNYYGIPKDYVEGNRKKGVNTLLVIDWQGAFKLMKIMRESVVSVFMIPPSMEELRRRLHSRENGRSVTVDSRLQEAPFEITHCYEYDYVIVNEEIGDTADKIGCILRAESMKTSRQTLLSRFIKENFSV